MLEVDGIDETRALGPRVAAEIHVIPAQRSVAEEGGRPEVDKAKER